MPQNHLVNGEKKTDESNKIYMTYCFLTLMRNVLIKKTI